MSLPSSPPRREKVEVAGEWVEVRGITRGEAARIKAVEGDLAEMEILIVAAGTDTDTEEVRKWYDEVSSDAVDPLVEAIGRLSGLDEEASKSVP